MPKRATVTRAKADSSAETVDAEIVDDAPVGEVEVHSSARLSPAALGDLIYLQMLVPVTGFGNAGDVIATVESVFIDSMIANGFARVVTSPTAVLPVAPTSIRWQPYTTYPAGWLVFNPSGQAVTANVTFTSGATYNAANWTVVNDVGSGGSGGSSIDDTAPATSTTKNYSLSKAGATYSQLSQVWVNALAPKYGAVVDGSTDNTAALDAAFADSVTAGKPLYIPAGQWVYNGNGFASTSPRVIGDHNLGTHIQLGTGVSLIVSPTSGGSPTAITRLDVRNLSTDGGFGLIRLTYTGAQSGQDVKIVDRCMVRTFTGAAVSSLASDDPYWKIKLFAGNGFAGSPTANLGIGVALQGFVDACDIDVDAQGVFCAVKLGYGGNSGSVRGSTVMAPYNGTPRAHVWVVPNISTAVNAGRGLTFHQFRFGGENNNAADYRILYADENTGSGTDFAIRTPAYSTPSTGIIHGHRVQGCLVMGAGTSPTGPVVFSTTPNVRGCHYDVILHGTPPDYILKFLTTPLALDLYNTTNHVRAQVLDSATPTATSIHATNAYGTVTVEDKDGLFARSPARILPYVGSGDLTGFKSVVTAAPGQTAGGVTRTVVTDAVGGTDACEATYSAVTDALYSSITAAALDIGKPTWIEFDLMQGQTGTPLTDVQVVFRDNVTGTPRQVARYFPVPTAWTRFQIPFTPRSNPAQQLIFYPHNETAGTVRVGRVNVYQSRSGPVNVRGQFPDQVVASGGVVTKYKATGAVTDADVTKPVDGLVLASGGSLYVRSNGVWYQQGFGVAAFPSLRPSAAIAETFPRAGASLGGLSTGFSTGRAVLQAIYLPKSAPITSLSAYFAGTAPSNPTNLWYGLADQNRANLGVTSDNGTGNPAGTKLTLPLATPFVTTYEGLHYFVVVIVGTGTLAAPLGVTTASGFVNSDPPIVFGISTSGLTTPSTAPTTWATLSPIAGQMYGIAS